MDIVLRNGHSMKESFKLDFTKPLFSKPVGEKDQKGGGKAGGRAIGRTVPGESARIEERGGDKLHQMKRRQGENVERPLDL